MWRSGSATVNGAKIPSLILWSSHNHKANIYQFVNLFSVSLGHSRLNHLIVRKEKWFRASEGVLSRRSQMMSMITKSAVAIQPYQRPIISSRKWLRNSDTRVHRVVRRLGVPNEKRR